jgi:hypothetical protein
MKRLCCYLPILTWGVEYSGDSPVRAAHAGNGPSQDPGSLRIGHGMKDDRRNWGGPWTREVDADRVRRPGSRVEGRMTGSREWPGGSERMVGTRHE